MANWDIKDDELIRLAITRVEPFYKNLGKIIEKSVVHRWPLFGMQGSPGVYKLMDQYQESMKREPHSSIQYAGDFMPQTGINQAMSSGEIAAKRIIEIFMRS